ncbi:protein CNPPD1 isoform X1 [Dermacentor variabilis]|uniref:protein CNPPD1 isoform X1 n=1 Tax=Dermacentor variabilis TaxID=34621 RepID=UPI003F5BDEE1
MNLFRAISFDNDQEDLLLGPDLQIFGDHVELGDRIRKTLYYGKLPTTDRPSLALTGISVEMFSKVLPNDGLKVLDMHYAASVSRRACITPCSMMLAMVYLDQLRHKNPQYMTSVSSCDLFLVSMLVASKFLYDDGEEDEVFNNEWAASANMELKDLNLLEREFLDALDWNLYVKPKAFARVLDNMETRIAYLESTKRGWTTYTDVCVLSKSAVLKRCWLLIYDGVIKVIAVSAIAYVAAALTLFGSAVLVHKVAHTSQQLLQCSSLGNQHINLLPAHSNASIVVPCVVPPFLSSCTDRDREDTVECVPDKPLSVSKTKPSCQHSKLASNMPTRRSISARPQASRVCTGAPHHPLVASCVEVTFSL